MTLMLRSTLNPGGDACMRKSGTATCQLVWTEKHMQKCGGLLAAEVSGYCNLEHRTYHNIRVGLG
jgi:hypothetical protein